MPDDKSHDDGHPNAPDDSAPQNLDPWQLDGDSDTTVNVNPSPDSPPVDKSDKPPQDTPTPDTTNWAKRHGDAVRWAQSEKQKAEALETRLRAFEQKSGMTFDELERMAGIQGGQKAGDISSSPNPDAVTRKELQQYYDQLQWQLAHMRFTSENAEFQNPKLTQLLGAAVQGVMQEDMRTNGQTTMTPEQAIKAGAKKVKAMVNEWREEGKRAAMTERKKIQDTGITEGDSGRTQSKEGDQPEDVERLWIKRAKIE